MKDKPTEKQLRADEEIRKNLPPGVKLVRTLRGHTNMIGRIAWSPDGRMLASPSFDKTIRLWDAATGQCLRTLRGHKEPVFAVAFAPDGNTLASGGGMDVDGSIRLWDTNNGALIGKSDGHIFTTIFCLAFDPTGQSLASGSSDASVRLWEVPSGKEFETLKTPNSLLARAHDPILCLAFDRTGQRIVIGSQTSGVEFWEPITGKIVRSLEGHGWATNFAFDSTGDTLASGGGDHTVKLWDLSKDRLIRTLEGHTDTVTCVGFLPNANILATKGFYNDNTVRLWHLETGTCLTILSEPTGDSRLTSLAFHPRLPLLATVGSNPGTPKRERGRVIHI